MKRRKIGNPPPGRPDSKKGPAFSSGKPSKAFSGRTRKKGWAVICLLLCLPLSARAGELSLGARFDAWTSNYVRPFNGMEFFAPLSLSFEAAPNLGLYGQAAFGAGGYTDSVGPTRTWNLAALSDTVVGGKLSFQSFGLPSRVDLALNLPTGDPTWENKQIASNLPAEFVDSRYRGRGFGASAFYGLSFPAGPGEFGAAAGYLYSGAFNPGYADNTFAGDLKTGDSVFLAVNHVQSYAGDRRETVRLSSYFFLPTQVGGSDQFQMGTNFNASYAWENPKALSFEVGTELYLPARRLDSNGQLTTEPHDSYAPRFYLDPSYSFGDFNLAGRIKWVLPNGYSTSDAFYDGGGWLLGLEPSYRLRLGGGSALRLYAGFDTVAWQNMGLDAAGNRVDVLYNLWTVGTRYEVKL